jgi:GntR family transcriptional repressor for pyruvate dehydrogenase complex
VPRRRSQDQAAPADEANGLVFEPAQRVRSSDDVSDQIRHAIATGRIREGQRLPAERELCEAFGISRPTLREALRSLEALGIIDIRVGKSGGAFAIAPSESTLGAALSTLLTFHGASPRDLAEFRLSFEVENAHWAAQRAQADDVATLDQLVERANEAFRARAWQQVGEIDAAWHEAVARATENRLRIGISLGLHEAVLRNHSAVLRRPAERGWSLREHARSIVGDIAEITRAIADRDAESAQVLMRAHVERGNELNEQLR